MSTIYLLSQHNTTEKYKSPEKNKASAEALAFDINKIFLFHIIQYFIDKFFCFHLFYFLAFILQYHIIEFINKIWATINKITSRYIQLDW